jgi:uncharacterized secreted protein with C-terminal beta-propeller domain
VPVLLATKFICIYLTITLTESASNSVQLGTFFLPPYLSVFLKFCKVTEAIAETENKKNQKIVFFINKYFYL